jgi:hypothetical protein
LDVQTDPRHGSGYRFSALALWLLPLLVLACVFLLYVVPTYIGVWLARRGHALAVVIVGNIAGCLAIAIYKRRWALGVFFAALGIEYLALKQRRIPDPLLIWWLDAVPALLMIATLVALTVNGRNWRRRSWIRQRGDKRLQEG